MKISLFCFISLLGSTGYSESIKGLDVFYAESVYLKNGKEIVQYIWRDHEKFRYEYYFKHLTIKTLVNVKDGTITGIFDAEKKYGVIPYTKSLSGSQGGDLNFEVLFSPSAHVSDLEEEKVNNLNCRKYLVDGGVEGSILCWIESHTGTPIKLADKDGGHAVHWRNFTKTPSFDGIFSIPVGYQKKEIEM